MSEPIRDRETAVRELGALPVPTGDVALSDEQRAQVATLIGDARPATAGLLVQLAGSVRDRLAHDHSTQREDWFCMNLTSFMGERMGPVLRRLLDAEAEAEQLRTRLAGELASPLAWARSLDAKSLDNFLIALGMAVDTDPQDGALSQAEEMIRSFRAEVPAGAEEERARTLHDHIVARDAEIERLRARVAELEKGPALPWAHAMPDDDLHDFLGDLVSAAMGRWQHSPEVPDREVLAAVEAACARWRTPGQGPRSDEAGPSSLAALRRAALLDLPPGTRWRVIATDSESLTGVAPVCTAERGAGLHMIPDHPGGPAVDEEGVYDCCPWPQIETYSVPVAAYLVALLNADAATAQGARNSESPESSACTKCGYGSDDWCVGCSACRCQPHLKGCMYAAGGAS